MPALPPYLADITKLLHSELPLTNAMGVELTAWDGSTVQLTAPLAPHVNHTATAFGGSIASLAILPGYTPLFLVLRDRALLAHILIQKSALDFVRPIDTTFTAIATLPAAAELDAFLTTLQQKRRSRITMDSRILTKDMLAATHTGLYVAIRQ